MLLRMAETHVRFGSFEGFHYTGREDYVKLLADYVIEGFFHTLPERKRGTPCFCRRWWTGPRS
ncbi:MAG: protein adenylyltransferase SelO family protein [Thermodesulfobacteriota bacterium]